MSVSVKNLVVYLEASERRKDFQPWDDDDHAIQNLITVFGVSEDDAKKAVELFQPTIMRL